MTFQQLVHHLWPAWLMGTAILFITFKSKFKSLLTIKWRGVKFFIGLVFITSIIRLICYHFFHRMTLLPVDLKACRALPWQGCLFVFWEDATHILPLMIFKRLIAGKKYMYLFYFATMFLIMLDFGVGHIYQSITAGLVMMLYIPVVMDLCEQFGVGTVMICHTIFDLAAFATIAIAMKGS